jgi:Zn-dependent peptidase ImmA (M78 family)
VTAANVLELHARTTGWTRSLPVPIESVAQDTYGMSLAWDDINETRNERILGVLQPKARVIVLNQRHRDLLSEVIGPMRFTLAHELGHWLYDADRDSSLFDHPVFCRTLAATDPRQVREVNANRLAAALLLPSDLVRAEFNRGRPGGPRTNEQLRLLARQWGVSRQTLRWRMEALGLERFLPLG